MKKLRSIINVDSGDLCSCWCVYCNETHDVKTIEEALAWYKKHHAESGHARIDAFDTEYRKLEQPLLDHQEVCEHCAKNSLGSTFMRCPTGEGARLLRECINAQGQPPATVMTPEEQKKIEALFAMSNTDCEHDIVEMLRDRETGGRRFVCRKCREEVCTPVWWPTSEQGVVVHVVSDTEDIARAFGFTPEIMAKVHFCMAGMLKKMGKPYDLCDWPGCELGVYRCSVCGVEVEATDEDVEQLIGGPEFIQCVVCKKDEDDALEKQGLGDCKLKVPSFKPRLVIVH